VNIPFSSSPTLSASSSSDAGKKWVPTWMPRTTLPPCSCDSKQIPVKSSSCIFNAIRSSSALVTGSLPLPCGREPFQRHLPAERRPQCRLIRLETMPIWKVKVASNCSSCFWTSGPVTGIHQCHRGNQSILIVDDNEDDARIFRSLVEDAGYAASNALSGKEGLESPYRRC